MCRIFFVIIYFVLMSTTVTAKEITVDEVYQQVYRVSEEINILKRHFNITQVVSVEPIVASFSPAHTWQKTYEILYKLNILRNKYGLPLLAVSSREPTLSPDPQIVFAQALRILIEIDIIKYQLDITDKSPSPPEFSNKTLTDNFNLLNDISYQIDLLISASFTPSHVFSQAMRINDDVNTIIEALNIQDDTIPPIKQIDSKPADAFSTALQLLHEVKRIGQLGDIKSIEIYPFEQQKRKNITPTEVFGITGIVLAELQSIKAQLGLYYELTPIAKHYENKTPADVKQMLDWCTRKLQLITTLNR